MRDDYLQIELANEIKQRLVINTQKGMYRYNILCFGQSTAPAIFKTLVKNLVAGIPGIAAYLDNIIVTGQTKTERLENLRRVLEALDNYGLKLQLDKCVFFAAELKCTWRGTSSRRTDCVRLMRGYWRHYITRCPRTSSNSVFRGQAQLLWEVSACICAPLNQLRCKDTPWKWSTECAVAFDQLKQMLADKTRLMHFDPAKPTVFATDASPWDNGAVMSHVRPDDSVEPIAVASKNISKAERGYAQIEKEGISIVYDIRKFNQYLSGRHPGRPQATTNDLRTG